MKPLNLSLSLEDTNKILAALGNMPYSQVYELIQQIQQQAQAQVKESTKQPVENGAAVAGSID
ncbi:MAG: hypothetical protein AAF587_36145 [Bacteroidota bacterium]